MNLANATRDALATAGGPICMTGATGFIGRHLLNELSATCPGALRCLVRNRAVLGTHAASIVRGELGDPKAVEALVVPGATVFNLAYDVRASTELNVRAAETIARVCAARRIRRLIHLSTATVVGKNRSPLINETSTCLPATPYERAKMAIEQALLSHAGSFELVIVRPTAVFGPGGSNLVKLAREAVADTRFKRRLRRFFHDARPLNLVSVGNVVAALIFAGTSAVRAEGDTYIISDSEEPANNYGHVQDVLSRALGGPDPALPARSVPAIARDFIVRALRSGEWNTQRRYSSDKLIAAGFQKPFRFEAALSEYGSYLASQYRLSGRITG
jgi:nucleoside-diphosphate-sugar epimerase